MNQKSIAHTEPHWLESLCRLLSWYTGSKINSLSRIHSIIRKKKLKIESICDGFAGSSCLGYFFKRLGKKVVTIEALSFPCQIARALIENETTLIDDRDINRVINARSREGIDPGLTEHLGLRDPDKAFLEILYAGIKLQRDRLKKALLLSALGSAMYAPGRSGRALALEFFKAVRDFNHLVCRGAQKGLVLQGDTVSLIKNVTTDAVFWDPVYTRSGNDFINQYRLLQFFSGQGPAEADDMFLGDRRKSFEALFDHAGHIPVWLLCYFENPALSMDSIMRLMRKFNRLVEAAHLNDQGDILMIGRKSRQSRVAAGRP